jgi:polyhydroxyalkanoate synthase
MMATEPVHAKRHTVHHEACLKVHRYARPSGLDGLKAPPVVLVYSFINKPTVLDLLPDRSVVRSLLGAGHDVFMVDWGKPGIAEAKLDLAGHAARLERAVRAAAAVAGSQQVSVLGYCLGGTMALLLGATAPELVTRIALLATPVVFEKGGTFTLWAKTPIDPAKLAATPTGNVPGELLREMFRWLDPMGFARKWITVAERGEDPAFMENFLAQERWANECVDFPGALYAEMMQSLYREDKLAAGTLELAGRKVALSSLRQPILNVLAEGDKLVPEEASLPLATLVGSGLVETLKVPGGHIGMTVGRRAPATTHASLSRFFGGNS